MWWPLRSPCGNVFSPLHCHHGGVFLICLCVAGNHGSSSVHLGPVCGSTDFTDSHDFYLIWFNNVLFKDLTCYGFPFCCDFLSQVMTLSAKMHPEDANRYRWQGDILAGIQYHFFYMLSMQRTVFYWFIVDVNTDGGWTWMTYAELRMGFRLRSRMRIQHNYEEFTRWVSYHNNTSSCSIVLQLHDNAVRLV